MSSPWVKRAQRSHEYHARRTVAADLGDAIRADHARITIGTGAVRTVADLQASIARETVR